MATIRQVAELAGVSVATVSRALNDSGYVSEDARDKVLHAVKELNFYPNEVARSLFNKKSKMVGLLLPDISNPYFTMLAKGAEDALNDDGFSLLLANTQDKTDKVSEYALSFASNNVAGVLSVEPIDGDFLKNVPLVNLDRVPGKHEYAVFGDDFQGGVLSAETILACNPQNIVVMVGPREVPTAQERLNGIRSVLEKQDIPFDMFQTKSYRVEDAHETVDALLNAYPNMDTVIATNDVYGAVVIREALKRGIQIPEDLQIIGYDNSSSSGLVYPGLTTIYHPAYDIGYVGAKLLCQLIQQKAVKEKVVQLPVQLVMRESLRKKV
ncbi:LacI family transcriptional regulator [Aerococcus agrisoli]|uniref:LacI family transcriptional regulator n=1 Tax=Aerococcus agrisoli TaxID=2487350 RepID=A0A3N4G1W0_9LACT|nr:LacI family DNA-binding transcriptional regulator [Aerococcus agrisoli]RPA56953.1 LacI family transcriptional regulator [Aerococcus agrisoli]